MRNVQRLRRRRLADRLGARKGAHAVLHRAHVLEERGGFPQNPVCQTIDAQGHRQRRRQRADADLLRQPQMNALRRHRERERHAQQMDADHNQAHQPHLAVHGAQKTFHRAARVFHFAAGVRKEFHRGDVGIGIDDAPGHQGARTGLLGRHAHQSRQGKAQQDTVQQHPAEKRAQQPEIKPHQHHADGNQIDGGINQHVTQNEAGIAHGQRGLHQAGRQATGKFVLMEGQTLPQQQAVKLPAQAHREIARQRLMAKQRQPGGKQRTEQNHHGQRQQRAAFLRPPLRRSNRGQIIAQPPQQRIQPRLKTAHDGGQQDHRRHLPAHAARARPDERP